MDHTTCRRYGRQDSFRVNVSDFGSTCGVGVPNEEPHRERPFSRVKPYSGFFRINIVVVV